jgi:TonB family protein
LSLSEERQGGGATAGLLVTLGIHLALVLAVLFAGRSEARTEPRPPKEMIIETRILEVQAGSPEGMRESGPAYKRREGARPQGRQTPKELHLGTSGRPATPSPNSMGPSVPSGPDDAADVPADWGSQTGVDAPPGARPTDDRHGAGGTAEQGALDPCFTQHAQVVAGYRAEVSAKIPQMARPAFVTVDVAQNLITSVRVAIDASGKIASVQVAKSSGNPRFDVAATDHVSAVGAFPAPHKCVMYDKLKGIFRSTVTFSVSIRSR